MSACKLFFPCLLFTALSFWAVDRTVIIRTVSSPGEGQAGKACALLTLYIQRKAGAGAVCAELYQLGDLCPGRKWESSPETHAHH